jgi:hypothetical protein
MFGSGMWMPLPRMQFANLTSACWLAGPNFAAR